MQVSPYKQAQRLKAARARKAKRDANPRGRFQCVSEAHADACCEQWSDLNPTKFRSGKGWAVTYDKRARGEA